MFEGTFVVSPFIALHAKFALSLVFWFLKPTLFNNLRIGCILL